VAVHTFNSSTQEAKAGGLRVPDQYELPQEPVFKNTFKATEKRANQQGNVSRSMLLDFSIQIQEEWVCNDGTQESQQTGPSGVTVLKSILNVSLDQRWKKRVKGNEKMTGNILFFSV
jgi:hypothetical protein